MDVNLCVREASHQLSTVAERFGRLEREVVYRVPSLGGFIRGMLAAVFLRSSASSGLVGYRDMRSIALIRLNSLAIACLPCEPTRAIAYRGGL